MPQRTVIKIIKQGYNEKIEDFEIRLQSEIEKINTIAMGMPTCDSMGRLTVLLHFQQLIEEDNHEISL